MALLLPRLDLNLGSSWFSVRVLANDRAVACIQQSYLGECKHLPPVGPSEEDASLEQWQGSDLPVVAQPLFGILQVQSCSCRVALNSRLGERMRCYCLGKCGNTTQRPLTQWQKLWAQAGHEGQAKPRLPLGRNWKPWPHSDPLPSSGPEVHF